MVGTERGSAAPLLALVVVSVGGLCLALGRLGGVATADAQAQTAADAAALAAAAEGPEVAERWANANEADVVTVEKDGEEVQVEVRVGDVHAVARAVGTRSTWRAGSAAGLVPELRAALDRAGQLLGEAVPITSGWRSHDVQRRLYASRGANPYPVAPPGTSAHEQGRAVDVPVPFVARLLGVAADAGLCRPWPRTDPVHFELCGRHP